MSAGVNLLRVAGRPHGGASPTFPGDTVLSSPRLLMKVTAPLPQGGWKGGCT